MAGPGLPLHEDLLDMLLCYLGEDNQDTMPDKLLRDEVTTMFMAGHETTAQSLSWIFYHLAKDNILLTLNILMPRRNGMHLHTCLLEVDRGSVWEIILQ